MLGDLSRRGLAEPSTTKVDSRLPRAKHKAAVDLGLGSVWLDSRNVLPLAVLHLVPVLQAPLRCIPPLWGLQEVCKDIVRSGAMAQFQAQVTFIMA